MIEIAKFTPKTVYVIYIASSLEKVWQALTDPAFTKDFFHGLAVEVEPRVGGRFVMRWPDGRTHIQGEVVEWAPPRRFACTWTIESMPELRELPPCLVTYDIEQAGESVRLTMSEAHSWDIPDAILSGGRAGWPAILSSLKSVLEIGKPLSLKLDPPQEMLAAVRALNG